MKRVKRLKVLLLSLFLSSCLFSCVGSQGEKGEQGNGILKIEKTGTEGNIDTYTITYTDGSTYNFQITNGEDGEPGLKGDKGDTGDEGPKGDKGLEGKDGTSLLSGEGSPNNNAGKNGDSYIDLASWDYYVKIDYEWILKCNIKGDTSYYEGTEGLAFYPINDNECAVGAGTAKMLNEIRIPSTYKNYKVTQIIEEGFEGCYNLKSLYFPKTITYCGRYAFSSCNIEHLYYSGSILDWCNISYNDGYNSTPMSRTHFYTLNNQNEYEELKTLNIPEGLSSLNNTFYGFSYITSVYFPKEVTKSYGGTFYNCYSIKTVYYNDTLNDWYDIDFSGSDSNPLSYADEFYVYSNNKYQLVTDYRVEDGSTSSSWWPSSSYYSEATSEYASSIFSSSK